MMEHVLASLCSRYRIWPLVPLPCRLTNNLIVNQPSHQMVQLLLSYADPWTLFSATYLL
jgi:hypothetical protein